MIYQIAVCDNEERERKRIEQFLQQYASDNLIRLTVDSYSCGEGLLEAYEGTGSPYDIVILDMEMPGIDGIKTADRIRELLDDRVLIVFVTDYSERVFRSLTVQAFQYLVKPLEYAAFHQKITDVIAALTDRQRHIMVVSQKDGEIFLDLDEIQCIETVKQLNGRGKLEITLLQEKLTVTGILNDYENKLWQKGFARVHRTALVNLRFVRRIRGDKIILKMGKELPLSRKYARKMREDFPEFFVIRNGR